MSSTINKTTVYWTDDHYQFLREIAHRNNMNMSEVLRQLLDRMADGEFSIKPEYGTSSSTSHQGY